MSTQREPARPSSAPQSLSERLCAEGLLSIVEAAALDGVTISAKQALRWALHGAHGVRLETVKVGGRRLTSRAAWRRFVQAQQNDEPPAARTLDAAAADAVLAAHGIGRA